MKLVFLHNNNNNNLVRHQHYSNMQPFYEYNKLCQYNISKTTNNQCYLIQNFQILLNEIPNKLQNLYFAVYPNNSKYNNLRFIYNKLLNVFPHAIFYPTNSSQISYLIKQFAKYNLDFAIRCGGHAYEPASLSSGYILDVTKLPSYIHINRSHSQNTAKISAGYRLGEVIEYLAKHSFIVPTGEASCVGISGISLMGGKGILTRMYGLMCDNIVSLKMINYQGNLITVNNNTNADLFWAMKGAGNGNFGVVCEIEMKIYNDIYCQFQTFQWIWNNDNAVDIFNTYQQWILTIPNNISANFSMIYKNGTASIQIQFIKYGPQPFTENAIFKSMYSPTITSKNGLYSKTTDYWVEYDTGNNPPFSKIKSSMIFEPISLDAIRILINSIDTYLNYQYDIIYEIVFSQLGGFVNNVNNAANSCYYPRDAIMEMSYFMEWTLPELTDRSKLFLSDLYNSMVQYTSQYCFANLIDYDIIDYMNSYYGTNSARLIQLKNKYDPNNMFKSVQSIR